MLLSLKWKKMQEMTGNGGFKSMSSDEKVIAI